MTPTSVHEGHKPWWDIERIPTMSKAAAIERGRVRILRETNRLLAGGHTRVAYARDTKGKSIKSSSSTAISFCLVGAVYRATENLNESRAAQRAAFRSLREASGKYMLAMFNDREPKHVIRATLNNAIKGMR